MSELSELVRPFPSKYVHKNPSGGGSYVKHAVIQQRLMQVLGPFTFEHVETIRGVVDAVPPNAQGKSARAKAGSPRIENSIVGVVARLVVAVDGRDVIVEEAGDCESPHNWPHDGARLKDAMSDAFKRCALRIGLGLHLWSAEDFYLFDKLSDSGNTSSPARESDDPAVSDGVGVSAAPASIPTDPSRVDPVQ